MPEPTGMIAAATLYYAVHTRRSQPWRKKLQKMKNSQVAYFRACVNFPPWYNDVHDLLVGRRNRPDARGRRIAATPGFAACPLFNRPQVYGGCSKRGRLVGCEHARSRAEHARADRCVRPPSGQTPPRAFRPRLVRSASASLPKTSIHAIGKPNAKAPRGTPTGLAAVGPVGQPFQAQ